MYFNPAKLSTVLAFIGAFASASAAPTSSEHNVNIRHANDKRVDYNDSYEYDKQDKNAHIEQLKEHQSEIEKQLQLVKQASEKNKFDDNKDVKDDRKHSRSLKEVKDDENYGKYSDYWKSDKYNDDAEYDSKKYNDKNDSKDAKMHNRKDKNDDDKKVDNKDGQNRKYDDKDGSDNKHDLKKDDKNDKYDKYDKYGMKDDKEKKDDKYDKKLEKEHEYGNKHDDDKKY